MGASAPRRILAFAAAILIHAIAVDASVTFRIGVSSNLLVVEGRVYFTQADGSLTCLDLQTGQVIGRTGARDYSGLLDSTPHGILLRGYDKCVLIDPATLAMRWEARPAFEAALDGETLITLDGDGSVERRSLGSGQVLWTHQMPHVTAIAVYEGHVLLHVAGRYPGGGDPTLALLDAESGAERFRIHPQPGEQFDEAFLGHGVVYVSAGPLDEYGGAAVNRLLTLDMAGSQVATAQLPSDLLNRDRDWRGPEVIDGVRFADGRPAASEPDWLYDDVSRRRTLVVGEMRLSIEPLTGENYRPVLTMQTGAETSWRGVLPYLSHSSDVSRVAVWNEQNVLLGSAAGHVECIDARSGHSKWIYVFPTELQVLSYTSPNGLPPYLDEMSEGFHAFVRNQGMLRGLCLVPAHVSEPSDVDALISRSPFVRTVFDPSPINNYGHVPTLKRKAWAGVLIGSVGLLLLIAISVRTQRRSLCLTLGVLLVGVLPVWLFSYGRVSFMPTQLVKVLVAACTLMVLWNAYACLRRGDRAFPVIAVLGVVFWLLYLRPLFVYA